MPEIPFLGPTYNSRSLNIAADRSINFFPELNPADAKSVIALIGTPGTAYFTAVPDVPVRGMHACNNMLYVVAGANLYSVNAAGVVSASLGLLATNIGRVGMADNGMLSAGIGGNQLMITDGLNGYILNVATFAWTTLAGGGWPGTPITVTYLDGYFIINHAGGMSIHVSNLFNGLTWNALATAPVQASPDLLQCVINLHQQLWCIKEYTTEIWYDTGTPVTTGSPFLRTPGAVLDVGTPAPWTVARGDNSIFFLACARGDGPGALIGVVEMSGYNHVVISPPAINYRITHMATVADAFAYFYSMEGHSFYVITFPTGQATFVYDATTTMWHEWSTYTGAPYVYGRHYSNCYAFFNGKHYVGDFHNNGNIYELRSDVYMDHNDPIVSVRISQHQSDKRDLGNVFFHKLVVDAETGVGNALSPNPLISLAWSDDGGHMYSSEHLAILGAVGTYNTRLIWRKLGCSRDRIFRITNSEPVKKVLIGGYVEATA